MLLWCVLVQERVDLLTLRLEQGAGHTSTTTTLPGGDKPDTTTATTANNNDQIDGATNKTAKKCK